jgi:hypothetical protein
MTFSRREFLTPIGDTAVAEGLAKTGSYLLIGLSMSRRPRQTNFSKRMTSFSE